MGVAWMWILDTDRRTVEIFENECGVMAARGVLSGSGRLDAPPFGDLAVAVSELFPY
jgi:hypothetical protein